MSMEIDWENVGPYITVISFLVLTAVVTIGFHHVPSLPKLLPESCVLIMLGVVVGFILQRLNALPPDSSVNGYQADSEKCDGSASYPFPTFTPSLFFFVLLPPVILESSYSIYDLDFVTNIGTILLYAVVGTIMNAVTIGPALYGLFHMGAMGSGPLLMNQVANNSGNSTYSLLLLDSMVFSSLISAVDPVAVLAIFQEVHIDRILYFLVFGESLLNDAVTIGLYHTLLDFAGSKAQGDSVSTGRVVGAFFKLLAIGVIGLLIGVLFGLLSALLTKTTKHVRVFEPLLILGIAFLSYMCAELFHFSGIISIIACGLVQSHYALRNISHKSQTTVKYFVKMASAISEAIIFLFLGMALFLTDHEVHLGFILWTLVLCLISRFLSVFLLTGMVNSRRVRRISFFEKFIMAYGGLRGAVCFSLSHMLRSDTVRPRELFLTTTLAVVFFTVFLQGITLKPLMKIFKIKKCDEQKDRPLIVDLSENVGALMLAGMEQVIGITGHFSVFSKIKQWDDKYLKNIFLISECEPDMLRAYRRHAQQMLGGSNMPGSNLDTLPPGMRLREKEKHKIRTILGRNRPMSLLRHNVDEDLIEEDKPSESRQRLHRASQVINAFHIQGAYHRQTFKPLDEPISAEQEEIAMDRV